MFTPTPAKMIPHHEQRPSYEMRARAHPCRRLASASPPAPARANTTASPATATSRRDPGPPPSGLPVLGTRSPLGVPAGVVELDAGVGVETAAAAADAVVAGADGSRVLAGVGTSRVADGVPPGGAVTWMLPFESEASIGVRLTPSSVVPLRSSALVPGASAVNDACMSAFGATVDTPLGPGCGSVAQAEREWPPTLLIGAVSQITVVVPVLMKPESTTESSRTTAGSKVMSIV